MGIAAGSTGMGRSIYARCRVIPCSVADRVSVGAKNSLLCDVGIVLEHPNLVVHRLLDSLFREFPVHIDDSHGKPELEGVPVFRPFHRITAVDIVRRCRKGRSLIFGQGIDRSCQIIDHGFVHCLLGVIFDGNLAVRSDIGIRDRAVCISHPVHHSHLEDIRYCKRHRLVGEDVQLSVVGIEQRYHLVAGKEHVGPVVRGIELGDCLGP